MSGSATRLRSWWPVLGVVALLALSNVMSNRVLPSPAYVPWGVAVTALLLGLAWADGCSLVDLGLSRERLGAGIGWGLSVFALVAAAYVLAVALPFSRDLFADDRVEGTGLGGAIYQVGFRIPLGTVLIEEVAFRGVLLAMVARRAGVAWGVAVSSALFGLWHILPSLGIEATNPVLDDTLGDAAAGALVAVGGAVLGTALAGVVFCWLRLRSGSLLAPMMLHTATNSLGFLVAWLYLEGL